MRCGNINNNFQNVIHLLTARNSLKPLANYNNITVGKMGVQKTCSKNLDDKLFGAFC
jgi:hypothetical protein